MASHCKVAEGSVVHRVFLIRYEEQDRRGSIVD